MRKAGQQPGVAAQLAARAVIDAGVDAHTAVRLTLVLVQGR